MKFQSLGERQKLDFHSREKFSSIFPFTRKGKVRCVTMLFFSLGNTRFSFDRFSRTIIIIVSLFRHASWLWVGSHATPKNEDHQVSPTTCRRNCFSSPMTSSATIYLHSFALCGQVTDKPKWARTKCNILNNSLFFLNLNLDINYYLNHHFICCMINFFLYSPIPFFSKPNFWMTEK